jgi:hypothetical protein
VAGRPSRLSQLDAGKSQPAEFELIDEYIDDPDWVVRADVVVETLGKQRNTGTLSKHVAQV